jgi:hypothetical protein
LASITYLSWSLDKEDVKEGGKGEVMERKIEMKMTKDSKWEQGIYRMILEEAEATKWKRGNLWKARSSPVYLILSQLVHLGERRNPRISTPADLEVCLP